MSLQDPCRTVGNVPGIKTVYAHPVKSLHQTGHLDEGAAFSVTLSCGDLVLVPSHLKEASFP